MIASLSALAGGAPLTEHSMRRMGAQYYGRNGVPIAHIQFLGRWGGATVAAYVGEALRGVAASASRTAASGGAGAPAGADHSLQGCGRGCDWPRRAQEVPWRTTITLDPARQ